MKIEINKHIIADHNICGGAPTFKGTRIMVWQVLELLGAGISIDEIIQRYFPQLTKHAILSVLTYASKILGEEEYVVFQE